MSLEEFVGWFVLAAGEQATRKRSDCDSWRPRPWGDEEFELYRKLRNESYALRERLTSFIRVPVREAELPRPEWDE